MSSFLSSNTSSYWSGAAAIINEFSWPAATPYLTWNNFPKPGDFAEWLPPSFVYCENAVGNEITFDPRTRLILNSSDFNTLLFFHNVHGVNIAYCSQNNALVPWAPICIETSSGFFINPNVFYTDTNFGISKRITPICDG